MPIFNFYFINFILEMPFVLLGFQHFFFQRNDLLKIMRMSNDRTKIWVSSYYTNDANGKNSQGSDVKEPVIP